MLYQTRVWILKGILSRYKKKNGESGLRNNRINLDQEKIGGKRSASPKGDKVLEKENNIDTVTLPEQLLSVYILF